MLFSEKSGNRFPFAAFSHILVLAFKLVHALWEMDD